MLEQRLGARAPSYVTMRRWAADGVFEPIEDKNAKGRRVRYSATEMLRIIRSRLAAKVGIAKKPSPKRSKAMESFEATARPEPAPLNLGHLEDLLVDMADRQTRLEKALHDVVTAVKSLDAVRSHLMTKYDAQNAANLELITQLKARLRSAEDIQSDMKITISLNRMADRIADLERELRRRG